MRSFCWSERSAATLPCGADSVGLRWVGHVTDLIECIHQIIDHHNRPDADNHGGEVACRCGLTRLSDYSRYVAEEIVKRLGCAPSMSATMAAAAVARIALVFAQSSALTAALPWLPALFWLGAGLLLLPAVRRRVRPVRSPMLG